VAQALQKQMEGTWDDYKKWVTEVAKRGFIFRGQSIAKWTLVSLWHRLAQDKNLRSFHSLLPFVHDYVSPWADRAWDLAQPLQLTAFIGFLRHHGFPTPLLDWTESPYMAAYFAFEGVNDEEPESDHVAIFAFNRFGFLAEWQQTTDLTSETPHVSLIAVPAMGNPKHIVQQSAYTFSSVIDQEQHIRGLEDEATAKRGGLLQAERIYLVKYRIDVKEKPSAMRELRLMGINATTLFPGSMEAVCKGYQEWVFSVDKIGETPKERLVKFLAELAKTRKEHEQTQLSLSINAETQEAHETGAGEAPATGPQEAGE